MFLVVFLLCLIVVLVFWWKYTKSKKRIVVNQVNVVTGAPKTCKSLMSLYLAKKDYKHRVFVTKFKNLFRSKKRKLEIPLFYSTIPVNFPHVMLTEDLLLRKERFRYNSVIFVDEAYLVADSQNFKDDGVNDSLSLFNKLIGHELKGGSLWYNTQNIHDVHYSIKRCATSYIYILSKHSVPFFMYITCRELVNSEEVSIVNTLADDPQSDPSFRRLLIPKKYFKYYDCYAYSKMTDNLPVNDNLVNKVDNLKTDRVISIKHGKNKRGDSHETY